MPKPILDNCPNCLRRDVRPQVDAEDYHGNPHTAYRCPRCGWAWTARRLAEPEADHYATYDDPDAWEAEDTFPDYDQPEW